MALVWGSVASAQTVGNGQSTQATGTKISVVTYVTTPLGVSVRQGSTAGSMSVEEVAKDRNFYLRAANIINNYQSATAVGSADSSAMQPLNGANFLRAILYPTVSDSASAVRGQIVYVSIRFGFGTANDSASAIPGQAPRLDQISANLFLPADSLLSVMEAGTTYQGQAVANNILRAEVGEIAVLIPPYDKMGSKRYFYVDLPQRCGEQYASLRVRYGPYVVYTTGGNLYYRTGLNAVTPITTPMRADLIGGR
jgi:hypothetical protein